MYEYLILILIILLILWIVNHLSNRPKKSILESELSIAVCESHNDVNKNVPYRLVKDSDNVIRIKQDYHLSSNNEWYQIDEEWFAKVSGVSYRKDAVTWFIAGKSRELEIIHEPMPKYPHALAVYGKWIDKFEKRYNEKLGYVDDSIAQKIFDYLNDESEISAKIAVMYMPIREKEPGLRIIITLFEPKN